MNVTKWKNYNVFMTGTLLKENKKIIKITKLSSAQNISPYVIVPLKLFAVYTFKKSASSVTLRTAAGGVFI